MKRDLVVLVPDVDIQTGLEALLERTESLSIRPIRGVTFIREPHRDPGVHKRAELSLQLVRNEFERALVVLDESWAGSPKAAAIERNVEARCSPHWGENVRCVCIVPEVEAWVWSDSPHVAAALGWPDLASLRDWLEAHDLWPADHPKPPDPKAAVEAALFERRIPRSPDLYRRVALQVSLRRCEDAAFVRLVTILRGWFPPVERPATD